MGDPQKLQELAEWMTQPARDALAALGHPTDALWVGIATNGKSKHPTGTFVTDWSRSSSGRAIRWSARTGVTDNTGWRPKMQRLRRTEQVIHRKPMGNTQETHDNAYVAPDPRTREHARDTMPRVQGRIVRKARMKVLGLADAAAAARSQDTAVVACSDISHSPFAEPGELCPVSAQELLPVPPTPTWRRATCRWSSRTCPS